MSHFDWGVIDLSTDAMSDAQLTTWAIEQLDQMGEAPFFLAVGYFRPHLPWYVPQEFFDRFPLDSIELPKHLEGDLEDIPAAGVKVARPDGDHAAVTGAGQWKEAVQGYLASVAFIDDEIGKLHQHLLSSPHADDTAIILWSDHGWHLGEKEHWRKFALWEEATRVVYHITVPGLTKPESRTNAAVDLMSVYPTVCEILGLPIPGHVSDPSLVPLLMEPAMTWHHQAFTQLGTGDYTLRNRRFRYIRYEDGSEEFYDHRTDPGEYTNLVGDEEHEGLIKRFRGRLKVQLHRDE